MKNIPIFVLVFILCGCSKNTVDNSNNNQTLHPQIANLPEPDTVLNTIASGIIKGAQIKDITHLNYFGADYNYHFEFFENTNRIKKIIRTDPNYLCQTTHINYFYTASNLIDKIKSVRINTCLEFEVKKVYHYNYKNGVLKSIIMENESFIEENYFAYNLNGTVSAMYTNFRPIYEPLYGFQKFTYTYDNHGNVKAFTQEDYSDSNYDKKYTFTYDENKNIFQGFFIILSFQQPSFSFVGGGGPFFLSKNNIISMKSEYIYHPDNEPDYEYYTTNYTNGKLTEYGKPKNVDYWDRYYIHYE